jgi:hypothetical protein
MAVYSNYATDLVFQLIFKVCVGYAAYSLILWGLHKYDWQTVVALYAFWHFFWHSKLAFK